MLCMPLCSSAPLRRKGEGAAAALPALAKPRSPLDLSTSAESVAILGSWSDGPVDPDAEAVLQSGIGELLLLSLYKEMLPRKQTCLRLLASSHPMPQC